MEEAEEIWRGSLEGEKIDSNSRFIEPILRGDFIYRVRDYLSAGMDISDGLFCDTDKLLDHNRLGFIELIKIDDEVGRSGEEYEMLIGFREEKLEKKWKRLLTL